ncbi:hypothetical protein HK097_010713 [Rhizophlyctis rosea]|uniref:Guanylate kinase n=1 Tax=Rhizophlyctis rosea TaxID=64517 RepID=A0AAD5SK93_9FUNG|nr:hypothetical protein HK097_010713 [Rhizophlyctis rosea]
MAPIPGSKRPLVVSGPSGSGKSTLLNKLFAKYPNSFGFSVSHTTREPRPGETPGQSYHYITREEFESLIEKSAFIEHAEFSGNRYGTSFEAVHAVQNMDKICVLDLEIKGVKSIKASDMNAVYCFIQPPSVEVLEARLRGRGTETDESLQKRLNTAKESMEFASQEGVYNIVIINDKAEDAYTKLEDFVLKNWEIKEEPTVWAEPTTPAGTGATTTGSATNTATPPAPQAPSLEGPTMTANEDILPLQTSPDAPPALAEKRGEDNSNRVTNAQGNQPAVTAEQKQAAAAGTGDANISSGSGVEVAKSGTEVGHSEEASEAGAGSKKHKKKGDKKSAVCNVL